MKQQQKIEELIVTKPAYSKLNDATIEQRIANNELGTEILQKSIYNNFLMIGEDNVLLG